MSPFFVWLNLFFLVSSIVPSKCKNETPDFYTFEVNDIEGSPVSLEQYRGKVTINFLFLCYSAYIEWNFIIIIMYFL